MSKYQSHILAKDVAKAARIEIFGLHYTVNWIELIARNLAVKALIYHEDCGGYYTDEQVNCIKARMGVIGKGMIVGKTKQGNIKNCC